MTKQFWRGWSGKTYWFTRLTGSNSISESDLSRGFRHGTKSRPYRTTGGHLIYGDRDHVIRIYATGEPRIIANVTIK